MTKPRTAPPADISIDRALPHNLEAERSVLGALLIHNSSLDKIGEHLAAPHFYRDAHRRIFAAELRVLEKHLELDFITLREELIRSGELDEVGGPAYLTALVDGLPHGTNIKAYANIVREKATMRALIQVGSRIMSDAYEAEQTAVEILKRADLDLLELQSGTDRRGFAELSSSFSDLVDDLDYRIAHKGQLSGLETGFQSINELTMGWQAANLICIGARPSIGKTVFVLNSALAAARAGKRVAFFSLEMKRRQLEYRMLSAMSGVPATKILTGYMTENEVGAVGLALNEFATLQIPINDRSSQSVPDVRMSCRRLKSEGGLDLVIIDYVQLMQGSLDRRGATRNEELTDISRKLKITAGELNVPIIILSQLKRLDGHRPQLSDLRESGSLEQDSDVVGLLHRKNHKESGITNFMLEKQRDGPTGTVNLTLDRDVQLFTDGGEETVEQARTANDEETKAAKTRAIIRNRNRSS